MSPQQIYLPDMADDFIDVLPLVRRRLMPRPATISESTSQKSAKRTVSSILSSTRVGDPLMLPGLVGPARKPLHSINVTTPLRLQEDEKEEHPLHLRRLHKRCGSPTNDCRISRRKFPRKNQPLPSSLFLPDMDNI